MPLGHYDAVVRQRLRALEGQLVQRAADLAVFLVFDRPRRAAERPGLARTFFAERCLSDAELARTVDAFRSIGAYVELFDGERPLLEALASGRLQAIPRDLKVIYNGLQNYAATDGFAPGRKALLPAVADAYGVPFTNSNAYACAIGRHKFHYLTVLHALGVPTPPAWQFSAHHGWAGARAPTAGTKVIAKSTYESWSVGVTEESVFIVDERCEQRLRALSVSIGQPVTLQQFVSGPEVNVPVFSLPEHVVTPPVRAVLAKAPGDADAVVTIEDNLRAAGLSYEACELAPQQIAAMRRYAVAAFKLLELEAFARIDFRVDRAGQPWVIDIGVEPGLAPTGSASVSASQLGINHASFLRTVIAAAFGARGILPSSPSRSRQPAA